MFIELYGRIILKGPDTLHYFRCNTLLLHKGQEFESRSARVLDIFFQESAKGSSADQGQTTTIKRNYQKYKKFHFSVFFPPTVKQPCFVHCNDMRGKIIALGLKSLQRDNFFRWFERVSVCSKLIHSYPVTSKQKTVQQ